jgi:hypothetical protein
MARSVIDLQRAGSIDNVSGSGIAFVGLSVSFD